MSYPKLYLIHGMGNDSIGLVEKITSPIAAIKGNIVDLRQDVMHGLFIINLVVDLSQSSISLEEFRKIIDTIADETGLTLFLDPYRPIPRDPTKNNILLILLGYDAIGIIATVTNVLKRYSINIEFSQMIAREGVFLMELLVDISRSTIPVENLKHAITKTMNAMNISTMFQFTDVFNKKKRIIVFDYSYSLMNTNDLNDLITLTGIKREELMQLYPPSNFSECMKTSARLLEGIPEDVISTIVKSTSVASSTIELFQTLKTMGYRIVLATNGFDIFIEHLKEKFGLAHAFGCPLIINDDRKCLTGEIDADFFLPGKREAKVAEIMEKERVSIEDSTTITDTHTTSQEKPGLGISIGIKTILDCYNQHIISRDNLCGIIGFFGPPLIS
ncbi:MAG: hypothetical protein N2316_00555 [Spirochaetes bacterium]|nr:hypothetical protein [Spirochaetota bacterium]